MVSVVTYQQKQSTEGKSFFVLTVQGEPEIVISQRGKPYLSAKRASLMTTFDELTCKNLVGKQIPGTIEQVPCEPYEVTTDQGEVITRRYRYEYQLEEPVEEQEEAVFQHLEDAFAA